jgi:hypothetical protein
MHITTRSRITAHTQELPVPERAEIRLGLPAGSSIKPSPKG